MSRHSFEVGDDTWTVGYDRPLRTFYAQVEPRRDLSQDQTARAAFLKRHVAAGAYDPDDPLLTVVGDQPRECPTVAHLTSALAARAVDLPDHVRKLLERDYLQAVAPTPLATVTRRRRQPGRHACTTDRDGVVDARSAEALTVDSSHR